MREITTRRKGRQLEKKENENVKKGAETIAKLKPRRKRSKNMKETGVRYPKIKRRRQLDKGVKQKPKRREPQRERHLK